MSWSKGHSSLTENPFNKPIVDRCINCGDHEQVQATITMEFERVIWTQVQSAVSVIKFIKDQE